MPVLHPGIKSDEEEAIINDNRCSLFQSIDFIICLNLCIVRYPYLTKQPYYGNSSTTRLAYYINPKTDFDGLKMRYWPLFSSFPYTPTNTSAYCRRDLSPFSIQKNTNNSRRYIAREKSCTTIPPQMQLFNGIKNLESQEILHITHSNTSVVLCLPLS